MNYEIISLPSISKWEPNKSFLTFQIKTDAGEEFIEVNNQVQRVVDNIDAVVEDLNKLIGLMGENTGTLTYAQEVVAALGEKRGEAIDYNKKLIESCNQVLEYVRKNKTTKAEEAQRVVQTLQGLQLAK